MVSSATDKESMGKVLNRIELDAWLVPGWPDNPDVDSAYFLWQAAQAT